MKKLLFVIPAVLLLASACAQQPVVQQNNQTPNTATQPTPTPTPQPTNSTTNQASDSKTYTNTEYGFQLTLTDAWNGYKVSKRSDVVYKNVKYLDFQVPAQDPRYKDFGAVAAPFGIAVYSKTDWNTISKLEGPKPTYITQNSNYVFAYYTWQDSPNDLMNVDFGIPKIVASFKAIQ
jgi:hypothetical protein